MKVPLQTKVTIINSMDTFYGCTGTITEYGDHYDYFVTFECGKRGLYNDNEISYEIKNPTALQVKLKLLTDTAVIPQYATKGAACFDLCADEDVIVEPGCTIAVSTGLAFEIPKGYKLCIYPRSGISAKTPLRIANAPAQIDSDYRGEVKVLLWNTANECACEYPWASLLNGENCNSDGVSYPMETYLIRKGDRIAQAEIVPVIQASFVAVDELSKTERGEGGFGSTGV